MEERTTCRSRSSTTWPSTTRTRTRSTAGSRTTLLGRRLAPIGGGISNARWENLYGGDGFWTVPDPTDPERSTPRRRAASSAASTGSTQTARDIQPKARLQGEAALQLEHAHRRQPHAEGHALHRRAVPLPLARPRRHLGAHLARPDHQRPGEAEAGGVGRRHASTTPSAEMHTTIYSISESPLDAERCLGRHRRRQPAAHARRRQDAGRTWSRTCPGCRRASWVSWVEASRFDAGTAYAAFDRHTFGDMTPWVYSTTDFGKTWTRIVAPGAGRARLRPRDQGGHGREGPRSSCGTELGLWISVDGGKDWAEFKGGDFPAVAVRDLPGPSARQRPGPRHARPRHLDHRRPHAAARAHAAIAGEATRPSCRAAPAAAAHAARRADGPRATPTFTGQNPPSGAVITYYQRTRHLFGPHQDRDPRRSRASWSTRVPPAKRRGINRVAWSMQVKPPRVPRAAQRRLRRRRRARAWCRARTRCGSPRAGRCSRPSSTIGLDRRAPTTLADRKAAVRRGDAGARALRRDERRSSTASTPRGRPSQTRAKALPQDEPLAQARARGKLDDAEEEDRRHQGGRRHHRRGAHPRAPRPALSALLSWEGKPAKYLIERIDALRHELRDVEAEFAQLAPQIHAMNLKLEPVRSSTPENTSACLHGEWDRCNRPAEMEAR